MRKQKKKKKLKKILLTVFLLLMMAAIAVAIGILLGNKERNRTIQENKTAENLSVQSVSRDSVAVSEESTEETALSSSSESETEEVSTSSVSETLSTSAVSTETETEILPEEQPEPEPEPVQVEQVEPQTEIYWYDGWEFAGYSQIHSSSVILYRATGENRRNIVVGLNAGHGTSGGDSVRTQCHPDGSAKVTGGSTSAGSTTATAIASGTTFLDGTPERDVTLQLALITREKLLAAGFDVLMIRETQDTQLDNIARTVYCNNNAQCHIALHFDSTDYDKGLYAMTVPNNDSYRSMYPVSVMWEQHNQLGECLVNGAGEAGVKVWGERTMGMDLTQTSYSTVPSVDIEMGDRATDHSDYNLSLMADGLVRGVELFFSAS